MKIVHMIISDEAHIMIKSNEHWLCFGNPHDQENGFHHHSLYPSLIITSTCGICWKFLQSSKRVSRSIPRSQRLFAWTKSHHLSPSSSPPSSSPPSSSPSPPPAALWWLPSDCEQMEKLGTSWKSIWNVINQDDIANCDGHSDEYQGLLWNGNCIKTFQTDLTASE